MMYLDNIFLYKVSGDKSKKKKIIRSIFSKNKFILKRKFFFRIFENYFIHKYLISEKP